MASPHPVFPLSIDTLQELTDNRNAQLLADLGDVAGLASKLHVDPALGLCNDEVLPGLPADASPQPHDRLPDGHLLTAFAARRHAYGTNFVPPTPPPSLLRLMWDAMHDRMLIILSIAAIASIAIGIYQAMATTEKLNWVEGIAILATGMCFLFLFSCICMCILTFYCNSVALVVFVNAFNDYRKARQFRFLSAQKHLTSAITVTRHSTAQPQPCQTTLPLIHLMVGDIVHLNTGDIVPADGVFISGHNCKVDESSVTGETDAITKALHKDRFFVSGSKVIDGVATYLVTSVGQYSLNGRTIMALRTASPPTPLQIKLGHLAENIAKLGTLSAILIVIIALIKFFATVAPHGWVHNGLRMTTSDIIAFVVNVFITGVTVIVVAVPEGLPMAVTMALGYATVRMLQDKNLVRVLSSCETMGGATTICSDKTGTLTQNKMTVVQGTLFVKTTFETVEQIPPRVRVINVANTISRNSSTSLTPHPLSDALRVFTQSLNINSTA